MYQVKFIVDGAPVPYVRTTQRQKFFDKQYKRYKEYKEVIQWEYIKATSRLKSKFTGNAGQTLTTLQRESLTRSTGLHTSTIDSADVSRSFVVVKIKFI